MVERCADCGFDLADGLVEVVPTRLHNGRCRICGRTAAPSCPGCSSPARIQAAVHGATASAATALANSTVFGAVAGRHHGRLGAQGGRPARAGRRSDRVCRRDLRDAIQEACCQVKSGTPAREAVSRRGERWASSATGGAWSRRCAELGSLNDELDRFALDGTNRAFKPRLAHWMNLKNLAQ